MLNGVPQFLLSPYTDLKIDTASLSAGILQFLPPPEVLSCLGLAGITLTRSLTAFQGR